MERFPALWAARLRSARIYTQKAPIAINTRDAMAELACGEWEGRSKVEVKPDPGLIRDTWDDRPPGGESYRDAEQRVGSFIREIRDQTSFRRILVVGHAGVNRVFLRLWLGLQPQEAVKIRCPHDAVFVSGKRRRSSRQIGVTRRGQGAPGRFAVIRRPLSAASKVSVSIDRVIR